MGRREREWLEKGRVKKRRARKKESGWTLPQTHTNRTENIGHADKEPHTRTTETYQDAGDAVDVAVDGVNVRQAVHTLGLAVVEDDEGLAIGVGLHLHTDLAALEGGLSCGEKGREGDMKM